MHALDSLGQAGNNRAKGIVRATKIVNSFEPDNGCKTGEAKNIAIQSINGGRADLWRIYSLLPPIPSLNHTYMISTYFMEAIE